MDRGGYEYISPEVNLLVTYAAGGGNISSIELARAIFLKSSNNQWFMYLALALTASSTARTSLTVNINGITFISYDQGLVKYRPAVATVAALDCYAPADSGNICWNYASSSITLHSAFGLLRLASKPTAYLPEGV